MHHYKKQITRKHALIIILVLSTILLLLPHAMRFAKGNVSMIGHESYYNAWHASIASGKITLIEDDPLSYEHGKDVINPYHILLSFAAMVMNIAIASKIIPFIMGIMSAALFYFILTGIKLTENKVFLSALFFVSSPIYIYIFTVSSHYSLIVFLNLLGLYSFMKNKKLFYLSLASYMVIALFGIYDTLASLSILLIYASLRNNGNKKNKKKCYIIAISMLIVSFLQNLVVFMQIGLPKQIMPTGVNFLQQFITVLGAKTGFSIFMLFLVASGLFIFWKDKKRYLPIYLFMFVFLILSVYFGTFANIYLNFLFSGFAGITIFRLIRRRWEISIVRDLLLIIILCGIIFSAFSHINSISEAEPNDSMIFLLTQFGKYSDAKEVVLSHPKNDYVIKYVAGKIPFREQSNGYYYYDYISDSAEREKTEADIFHARNLADMTSLIENNSISYILIDEAMKKGLVWKEEKQEALFLLTNKETFKRLIANESNELYMYKGQPE